MCNASTPLLCSYVCIGPNIPTKNLPNSRLHVHNMLDNYDDVSRRQQILTLIIETPALALIQILFYADIKDVYLQESCTGCQTFGAKKVATLSYASVGTTFFEFICSLIYRMFCLNLFMR